MSQNQNNQNVQTEEQSESSKIGKKFETNMKQLVAVLGGNEALKAKTKVKKDAIATIVEEILKEKKETAVLNLRNDLSALITKKVEFDRTVAEEAKKFEKFKEDKMKEFNGAAEKMFAQIEGISEMEKEYYASVSSMGSALS